MSVKFAIVLVLSEAVLVLVIEIVLYRKDDCNFEHEDEDEHEDNCAFEIHPSATHPKRANAARIGSRRSRPQGRASDRPDCKA